jgi:O-antigen biosynthesis protein
MQESEPAGRRRTAGDIDRKAGGQGEAVARPLAQNLMLHPLRLASALRRLHRLVKRIAVRVIPPSHLYHAWIQRYETITPELRAAMAADISTWQSRPTISVIIRGRTVNEESLTQAIDSVLTQIYPYWELHIADSVSTIDAVRPLLEQHAAQDSRIHVTSCDGDACANANASLALARGDYIAFTDAGDLLSEDALFWAAREIALHPEVDLLFSDEDSIDRNGVRFDPNFKSAWNQALMLSQNAFGHLGIYRRRLVDEVGCFRQGLEGADEYDLVLRCARKTKANRIRHIPRVLYHRRAPHRSKVTEEPKSLAWEAGRRAITDNLRQAGIRAQIRPMLREFYQVEYEISRPLPLVSVLVPTTLRGPTAAQCLCSVLTKSSYENYELLILVHAEDLRASKGSSDLVHLLADPRVRVIDYEEAPFNFSQVNNLGARSAYGNFLCFLNDDVEVITEDWLERLVARAMLEGVGASGPMLYYPTDVIQHAGVILMAGDIADHAFKHSRRGSFEYFGRGALEQDYSCVTAACMLINRKAFERAGGFDETLPIAFNDVDLCIKIRRAGLRIVWTPSVEMNHHESLSFGHYGSSKRYRQFLKDVSTMRERWKDTLEADPCYNPNLSLVPGLTFSLAWPPRLADVQHIITSRPVQSISRTSDLILQEASTGNVVTSSNAAVELEDEQIGPKG